MGTRVVLIEAGPTPWDMEGRLVGSRPLPLTAEAIDAIRRLVDSLPFKLKAVYRPKQNEACDQAAKLIAQKFNLGLHHSRDLDAVSLGLWEGLTADELKFRFPTVFPQWQKDPLAVTPPDGPTLQSAIDRIAGGLRRILRRNRTLTIALAVRPMTMQIIIGILKGHPPQTIASHLHDQQPMATIEVE